MRDRKEQTLSLAVPPRRGADSSALYQNNECPDVDDTARALEEAGADAEMSIQSGLDAAGSALNNPEISESINKAMQELHRELAENNGELNRTIRNSMNAAASELQAHGDELQRAMQEASRRLEKMRDSFADSMQ
jgi:DNA anti-recombination protein RmuC